VKKYDIIIEIIFLIHKGMPLEDKKNDDIDTSNIFEELSEDSDLKQEVKGIVESQDKDLFYYLSSI
jgi:hypothetical protein